MLASLRRFAGLVLLWSIPGVTVGLQSKAWELEMKGPWGTHRFLYVYAGWVIWAVLTPPLAWLVRRFAVERYGLPRVGALHVVACTVFLFFQEGYLAVLSRFIGPYNMRQMSFGAAPAGRTALLSRPSGCPSSRRQASQSTPARSLQSAWPPSE